ncbi:sulfur carrier protein ThiS [Gloeobacter kilaueensis]|uniref:Thiamine biosynthesis protein ThiS n=1 Tax=Gloeobacter kilaueensis (strain ATCC BAA-2537 / CCAP 1431/1 / ULC 316 / JS1) TaxID=1183438 RepID=U5QI93_GLOK1|nr:sulfur carrier protein ThiS [Gloeobacter kilaueensis]AGY58712.1 thiamine biosynthesis protein ThiS [Gloeobacter kilaueensis JS1]
MEADKTIRLNGDERAVAAGTTVLAMLEQFKLEPRLLVIERNGDILHRQDWQKTIVQSGDRFEIVTVVGGG